MKNKLLAVALIGVILGFGMVLIGCSACPGGAIRVSRGNCTSEYDYGKYYDECTNKCITAQGTSTGGEYYTFSSKKDCTCD